MNNFPIKSAMLNQRQSGIALVLGLIFLLVSTLLGVHTLRGNVSAEKMTRANIQREQALEAAEFALLEGEKLVRDFDSAIITAVLAGGPADTCSATIDGANGICRPIEHTTGYDPSAPQYDHWIDITSDSLSQNVWTTASKHRSADDTIKTEYGLATAPKYIVEFMGYTVDLGPSGTGTSNCSPTIVSAYPYCTTDSKQFRITAFATSGNQDETRVMLQTTYITD